MVRLSRLARPIQPPVTDWAFPPPHELPADDDLVAVGADLEPGTLLRAYSAGYFPMPVSRTRIGWFHPEPRGVLPVDRLNVSRSLRRSLRRFTVTVDQSFDEVIEACADPSRPMGWIDNRMRRAYSRLYQLGWAHSVEVWDDDGLAGGLYGVALGGLFAGESMFHRRTDASKVALVRLIELLDGAEDVLLDVQWVTPHLESLGAVAIPRIQYCTALERALVRPLPSGLFTLPLRTPGDPAPH
jgi:leucyl/phenylalanyl-tRNA---protein transferase